MARITNRAKICLDQSMESTITKKNSGVKLDNKKLSGMILGNRYYPNTSGMNRKDRKQLSSPLPRNQCYKTIKGERMDGKPLLSSAIPRNKSETSRGNRMYGKQISSSITQTQMYKYISCGERKQLKLSPCPTPGINKQLSCTVSGENYYPNATGVKNKDGKQLSSPIRRNQNDETTRGKRMGGKKLCSRISRNQYETTRGKRVDGKQISSPIKRTETYRNKSGGERKDIKLSSCPTPGFKNYQNTSGRKKMGETQSSSPLPRNWYHKNASGGEWNTNGRKEEHVSSRLIPEIELLYYNIWDDGSSQTFYSSSNSESKGMEFASVETIIPMIETADNKELSTLALEQDRGLEPTTGSYDKFAHLLYFRPIYSDLHLLKPKVEPVTEDESMKDTITPEIECKVTEDKSMKDSNTLEIECKVTEEKRKTKI